MERSQLSVKWLEVFQAVARSGSVQHAAERLDISISTVSHHLTCLERAVGVTLIDHRKRPMRLTTEGDILLRRVDESLGALQRGMAEVRSKDPRAHVRSLKIAMVEDLDAQVAPELAAQLARELPSCELAFLSRPSHDILTLLQSDEIDMGIASISEIRVTRLTEAPLLRDPYLLVAPKGRTEPAEAYLRGSTDLPFLRYSKRQLMGRRIEAQLRRLRLDLPARLEFESTPAILSMVAAGRAWTITTALNLAGSAGLRDRLNVMPLPDTSFVRQLSAFRAERMPESLFTSVDVTLRQLIAARVIAPLVRWAPWLEGKFRLLDD